MNAILRNTLVAFALLGLAQPASADVIADWNLKAEAIQTEKRLSPPANARAMAILHVAMFEAVNAIERRYAHYRLNLPAERTFSKEAAAVSAAHAVLVALYPEQQTGLDTMLKASLAEVAEGEAKAKGIELGKKAAEGILALRANDGANAAETYRPHTSAGVYVPTVVPVSSTDGNVTPWVMKSGSQFRPAPPPALDSAIWTNDLNEIRELGAKNSTKRTAEQTSIGRFWFVTGPQSWNPIVRQVVAANKLALVDSARLFALVAMAGHDALIAVFDAKYAYNFWRPVTAIRNTDLTGNKATPRDPSWLPLGDTPMHPEFPCAHCITSAAVAAALEGALGSADMPEVTMTSPTAPGTTRRWTNIWTYADEVAMARIYAGFHYRFSTRAGQDMGRSIGRLVVQNLLQRTAAAR
jgi:hypothetical protein